MPAQRLTPRAVLAVIVLAFPVVASATEPAGKPNVVFILADDLGCPNPLSAHEEGAHFAFGTSFTV